MTAKTFSAGEVADWLSSLPRTTAHPVRVTIGRTTYVGARYEQVRDISPGTRAHAEGKREYVQRALYLLGSLPAAYVRDARTSFATDDETTRYFVASWFGQDGGPESNEWHPFGAMLQLMPDDSGEITSSEHVRPMRVVSA
jgi:hypothetical protein